MAKRKSTIGTKAKPYKGKGAHQKAQKRAKRKRVGYYKKKSTGRVNKCTHKKKC